MMTTQSALDQVRRLIHISARYLDDKNFDAFLTLFAENGEYMVTSRAPELAQPMIWMHCDRTALTERIAAAPQHQWEILQSEQTRVISVDVIEGDEDAVAASSSFALFTTDSDGRSRCYAVGRYDDRWRGGNDNWALCRREVILKTRLLATMSPLPI